MRLRIRNIADQAGLLVSTVSRVMNRMVHTYRISEETEERVLQTAPELKYFHHQLIQSLRLKNTYAGALLMPFPISADADIKRSP